MRARSARAAPPSAAAATAPPPPAPRRPRRPSRQRRPAPSVGRVAGSRARGRDWPPASIGAGRPARRRLGQRVGQPREQPPRWRGRARRVDAPGAEQVARQRDRGCGAPTGSRPRRRHRVGDQLVHRHRRVGDAVDERGVGAVLQQPPHQVGQQRLVRADRRVDAARPARAVPAHHLVVERLAHAVQALELVLAGREVLARHAVDGGHGLRVVGGELREHRVRRRQQLPRAGEVGHVGVQLAREHRIAVEPVHLRPLDLAVPVGALDQAHHQPVAGARARGRSGARSPAARAAGRPAPRSRCRPTRPGPAARTGSPAGRARAPAGRPPRRRC